MAPSTSTLEGKLRTAVEEVYASENQENLTVRFIRDKVESELHLDAGFFLTPEWKDKSKAIIKGWATKLMDEGESMAFPVASIEVVPKAASKPKDMTASAKKAETPVKKGTKRGSQGEKARPNKRQKKEDTPSDSSEDESSEASFDEESPVSDFEADSDVSEAPKSKRQSKSKSRTPNKRNSKRKTVVSDESEDDDISEPPLSDQDEESDAASTPPKKAFKKAKDEAGARRQSKKSVVESDEESEDETPKIATPDKKPGLKKTTPKKVSPEDAEIKANDSDESEMSVVIDEPPKQKQKRRTKSEMASSSSKPVKGPKAPKTKKEPAPGKDLTPVEAEIKTLQSHLVKCGVRKIWAFELKQYGEDNKAKIRHLQGMLKDIGMVGRFSESRAREIKELRELQADLEAVKEGDSKWGLESGRRNRGQRKSFKEDSDEDEDDEEGGVKTTRSRSTSETPKSKAARAKQELAFLGDEDSSDSD